MNLLMLKYIFYEYFFFDGAGHFIDSYQKITFPELRNKIISTQSNFSSILFKFVAFLDLKKEFKQAVQFLNFHLEFLFENQIHLEAYFLVHFILRFVTDNKMRDINTEYYQSRVAELEEKLVAYIEKESHCEKVAKKYEYLRDLIQSFDFDSNYLQKDYLYLKVVFKSYIKNTEFSKMPEYKQIFFMFGEQNLFNTNQLDVSLNKSGFSDNRSILSKKFFSNLQTIY